MKTYFFIPFIFILLICCQDKTDSTKENTKDVELTINNKLPEKNQSTPDQAVMSYIKYIRWKALMMLSIRKQFLEGQRSNQDVFFAGEYPDSLKNSLDYVKRSYGYIDKDVKSIEDVKTLSDSRAKVIVQTDEKTYGIYGDKVSVMERYSLVKNDDSWLIEKIEVTCNLCDGVGKVTDYDYSFNKVYKQCESCIGTGWAVYVGAINWW